LSKIYKKINIKIISTLDRWIANFIRFILPGANPPGYLRGFGGYVLSAAGIQKDSLVYSFGVGSNIDFEEKLSEKFECGVFMFDPTPPALELVSSKHLPPLLLFEPIGVWTKSGTLKFYTDGKTDKERKRNFSLTNFFKTDTFIEAQCLTLSEIMRNHGHTHIDLLKVDIEGAAIDVLTDMLNQKIFPNQIVGEVEIPKLRYKATPLDIIKISNKKRELLKKIELSGYRVFTYNKGEFTALRKF